MRNAQKLRNAMRPGRVYRRHELRGFSTAVDRDLKTLLADDQVKKLSGGLYYRPRRNAFGSAPPGDHGLVRAFLKTDDFLLTSYTHFNPLGLGLTQVYGNQVVYNHKRTGEYTLGGKRFTFRRVPSYPDRLSREFLLVDLLNNLRRLPDDADAVLRNLPSHLKEFDPARLRNQMERYGSPRARRMLMESHA